ncbi:hypothetical protein [Acidaminobacter hydrogenoformans]|uniref:Uncharacterized protein n=1 Tax=Acidaminobacter hydrogenoformans DSM 2784 TaxID=1120920 RepID=A0A1G5RTP0_9FIRM|nr:hypothetical protein [Acidaminobacter hydrogenoformans]SCZ76811.1 hypothetical protein SAMN03080599_00419 [Acidaminobacter hydrogenoformans DSM 2784]
MQRLKKNDLVVKSPGLQIRERIQLDYGDLKTFAKKIDMSESSVDQYLTHKNLGSSTFKIRLTRELGQDFRNLYKSDQAQVEELIDRYMIELCSYDRLCELQMSEVLHELAKSCNAVPIFMAKVYYGLSLYRDACGENEKALAYLNRGLLCLNELDLKADDFELKAMLLARMIWIERKTSTKEKLLRDLNSFSICSGSVNDPERRSELILLAGRALLVSGEASAARRYFNQAEDAALSEASKGRAKLYSALTAGDIQACHVELETAERLLRGNDAMVPELLLTRAKLSEHEDAGRETLNYLQMALERCGRHLTAHSAELSALWFMKLLDEVQDEAEYDKLFTAHVLHMASELRKGYKYAREHLNEACACLDQRALSARGSLDLLKALGKVQHPQSYHPTIAPSYYQLLGKLAAEAFGHDLPDALIDEFFEEDSTSE